MTARVAAALVLIAACAPARAADIAGTWLNEDRDGIVRIDDCGALRGTATNGTLCGVVVWIRDAVDPATGLPPVDRRNADPALRDRPILGLEVVSDMRPSSTPGRWDGRIYNIDDGKSYGGNLIAQGDTLRVQGCVMLICQGETWTRAPLPAGAAPAGRTPAAQRAR